MECSIECSIERSILPQHLRRLLGLRFGLHRRALDDTGVGAAGLRAARRRRGRHGLHAGGRRVGRSEDIVWNFGIAIVIYVGCNRWLSSLLSPTACCSEIMAR